LTTRVFFLKMRCPMVGTSPLSWRKQARVRASSSAGSDTPPPGDRSVLRAHDFLAPSRFFSRAGFRPAREGAMQQTGRLFARTYRHSRCGKLLQWYLSRVRSLGALHRFDFFMIFGRVSFSDRRTLCHISIRITEPAEI